MVKLSDKYRNNAAQSSDILNELYRARRKSIKAQTPEPTETSASSTEEKDVVKKRYDKLSKIGMYGGLAATPYILRSILEPKLGTESGLGRLFYGKSYNPGKEIIEAIAQKGSAAYTDSSIYNAVAPIFGHTVGDLSMNAAQALYSAQIPSLLSTAIPALPALSLGLGAAYQQKRINQYRDMHKQGIGGKSAKIAETAGAFSQARNAAFAAPIAAATAMQGLGIGGGLATGLMKAGTGVSSLVGTGLNMLPGLGGLGLSNSLMGAMGLGIAPALLGGIAGVKADMNKRRLRGQREPHSKIEKRYRISASIDPIIQRLVTTQQMTPAEQVQAELLMMIESHTSPIGEICAILKFQEEQRKKDLVTSENEYDSMEMDANIESAQSGTFTEKSGIMVDKATYGLRKFANMNPITQLSTWILEGKKPQDVQRELYNEYSESFNKAENVKFRKEATRALNVSYSSLKLLDQPASKISKLAEAPASKQVVLLSALYDITRAYIKHELFEKAEEKGVKAPEEKIFEEKTGIEALIKNIPFISGLYDVGKVGFKAASFGAKGAKNLFDVARGKEIEDEQTGETRRKRLTDLDTFKFISKKIIGGSKTQEYADDPTKATRELGLHQDQKQKVFKFFEIGLPNKLDEITTHEKRIEHTLYQIYEVENKILQTVSGEGRKYEDVDIQGMKYDHLTGEYMAADDYDRKISDREKEIREHIQEKTGGKTGDIKETLKKGALKAGGLGLAAGATVAGLGMLPIIPSVMGLGGIAALGLGGAGLGLGKTFFGDKEDGGIGERNRASLFGKAIENTRRDDADTIKDRISQSIGDIKEELSEADIETRLKDSYSNFSKYSLLDNLKDVKKNEYMSPIEKLKAAGIVIGEKAMAGRGIASAIGDTVKGAVKGSVRQFDSDKFEGTSMKDVLKQLFFGRFKERRYSDSDSLADMALGNIGLDTHQGAEDELKLSRDQKITSEDNKKESEPLEPIVTPLDRLTKSVDDTYELIAINHTQILGLFETQITRATETSLGVTGIKSQLDNIYKALPDFGLKFGKLFDTIKDSATGIIDEIKDFKSKNLEILGNIKRVLTPTEDISPTPSDSDIKPAEVSGELPDRDSNNLLGGNVAKIFDLFSEADEYKGKAAAYLNDEDDPDSFKVAEIKKPGLIELHEGEKVVGKDVPIAETKDTTITSDSKVVSKLSEISEGLKKRYGISEGNILEIVNIRKGIQSEIDGIAKLISELKESRIYDKDKPKSITSSSAEDVVKSTAKDEVVTDSLGRPISNAEIVTDTVADNFKEQEEKRKEVKATKFQNNILELIEGIREGITGKTKDGKELPPKKKGGLFGMFSGIGGLFGTAITGLMTILPALLKMAPLLAGAYVFFKTKNYIKGVTNKIATFFGASKEDAALIAEESGSFGAKGLIHGTSALGGTAYKAIKGAENITALDRVKKATDVADVAADTASGVSKTSGVSKASSVGRNIESAIKTAKESKLGQAAISDLGKAGTTILGADKMAKIGELGTKAGELGSKAAIGVSKAGAAASKVGSAVGKSGGILKSIGKWFGSTAARHVVGVGAAIGYTMAGVRLVQGDITGALLEAASGTVNLAQLSGVFTGGIGTAAALAAGFAIDAIIFWRDYKIAKEAGTLTPEMEEKAKEEMDKLKSIMSPAAFKSLEGDGTNFEKLKDSGTIVKGADGTFYLQSEIDKLTGEVKDVIDKETADKAKVTDINKYKEDKLNGMTATVEKDKTGPSPSAKGEIATPTDETSGKKVLTMDQVDKAKGTFLSKLDEYTIKSNIVRDASRRYAAGEITTEKYKEVVNTPIGEFSEYDVAQYKDDSFPDKPVSIFDDKFDVKETDSTLVKETKEFANETLKEAAPVTSHAKLLGKKVSEAAKPVTDIVKPTKSTIDTVKDKYTDIDHDFIESNSKSLSPGISIGRGGILSKTELDYMQEKFPDVKINREHLEKMRSEDEAKAKEYQAWKSQEFDPKYDDISIDDKTSLRANAHSFSPGIDIGTGKILSENELDFIEDQFPDTKLDREHLRKLRDKDKPSKSMDSAQEVIDMADKPSLIDRIFPLAGTLTDSAKDMFDKVKSSDTITNISNSNLLGTIKSGGEKVLSTVSPLTGALIDTTKDVFNIYSPQDNKSITSSLELDSDVKESLSKAISKTPDSSIIDNIKSKVSETGSMISDMVPDGIKDSLSKAASGVISNEDVEKIKSLQLAPKIPEPTMFDKFKSKAAKTGSIIFNMIPDSIKDKISATKGLLFDTKQKFFDQEKLNVANLDRFGDLPEMSAVKKSEFLNDSNFGKLSGLSFKEDEQQPEPNNIQKAKSYEESSVGQNEMLDRLTQIIPQVQQVGMPVNTGVSNSDIQGDQKRAVNPHVSNIVENIFSNTITSLSKSIQSFGIGQVPFQAIRS